MSETITQPITPVVPTPAPDMCKWHQKVRPCDECGRPTKMTPDTFARLEEAFSTGCSVEEACYYANLGETTFYDFCKENSEFREHLYRLQQKPILLARKKVIETLDKDGHFAFEFLQKKRPHEFAGERMTVEFGAREKIENNEIIHPEDRQAMRVALETSVRNRILAKRDERIASAIVVEAKEVTATPQ